MPQKLPTLCQCWASQLVLCLDTYKQRMLRLVSEVEDMETRLGLAGRDVDPVFQHSWRHCVGFIHDLVKAGSVGFVEAAVEEHVELFFVAKKAGAQRFIVDARASNRHFLNPPSGRVARRRGTLPCRISGCR